MRTEPLPGIIRFLQRPNARETWEYERAPILFVELLCLMAGIWAAPTTQAAWLGVVTAPLALWAAELARADRSAAARKAERAAALGLPKVQLTCEASIVQASKNKQILTAAAPVVGLAMSVAGAGGAGLSRAAVAGFVVSVVRWLMVELYGVWRRWYRGHVPVFAVTPSRAPITPPNHARCRSVLVPNDALGSSRGEQ